MDAHREEMLRHEQVKRGQEQEEEARADIIDEAEPEDLPKVDEPERSHARRAHEHREARQCLHGAP